MLLERTRHSLLLRPPARDAARHLGHLAGPDPDRAPALRGAERDRGRIRAARRAASRSCPAWCSPIAASAVILFASGRGGRSSGSCCSSTPLGLHVRAVTQNRSMAASMGISTRRVDMWTFGIGSGVAGLGRRGAVPARQRGTRARPGLHRRFVHGRGAGRRRQARGHARWRLRPRYREQAARAAWPAPCSERSSILVFIILFIQRRPQGIFALKGRAAEVS